MLLGCKHYCIWKQESDRDWKGQYHAQQPSHQKAKVLMLEKAISSHFSVNFMRRRGMQKQRSERSRNTR